MWETDQLIERNTCNPILTAIKGHPWESQLVYNTAAIRLKGRIYLLYRAMGDDHIARFGLAISEDGVNFNRLPYPVFLPTADYEIPHPSNLLKDRERGGVEDPRIMIIDDTLYVIYTAFHKMCHLALAKISLNSFCSMVEESEMNPGENLSKDWNASWERIGLIFPELFEVPELFSRNSVMLKLQDDLVMLFYRIHKGDVLVSLSKTPEGPWKDKKISFFTKRLLWETERIGISTPAIPVIQDGKTTYLFFYHGVEEKKVADNMIKVYHLGAFFLSVQVEEKKVILKTERLKQPVLSPERDYEVENEWLNSVGVHAVFSCGAVLVNEDDLYIYYGSGDSNISVAKASIARLLQEEKITEYCEIDRESF